MKKTLLFSFLILACISQAKTLPAGKSKIIMYNNFKGEETIYKRPTTNVDSFVLFDNQKDAIAIYIDGYMLDILYIDYSQYAEKDGDIIFKATSGLDEIEKNCMIHTIDSPVGQIQELWIERGNGSYDIFAISSKE